MLLEFEGKQTECFAFVEIEEDKSKIQYKFIPVFGNKLQEFKFIALVNKSSRRRDKIIPSILGRPVLFR